MVDKTSRKIAAMLNTMGLEGELNHFVIVYTLGENNQLLVMSDASDSASIKRLLHDFLDNYAVEKEVVLDPVGDVVDGDPEGRPN